MLRVCDHTACESCPDSLQFVLWSFRTPSAKTGTHPVLSRVKYGTVNQALHSSEDLKCVELNLPEVPEARLLLFLKEGGIKSLFLNQLSFKSAVPIRSRGNPE